MKILVTGSAGFIGFHLIQRLLSENYTVVGLDNINSYYSQDLKYGRLAELGVYREESEKTDWLVESTSNNNFSFLKANLCDREKLMTLFEDEGFDAVINLAAQVGVRHSIDNPHAYASSNMDGFLNILEACRQHGIGHLIFASSSSVYGANTDMPFKTSDQVDRPVSLYAATKKANELMAHAYSNLYGFPTTGLRFFTVYGPWGRPDMAYFKFANLITNGNKIDVYNHGKMARDFTYIDDIVECIERLIPKPPQSDEKAPFQLFNIGNGSPVNLLEFIEILEKNLGVTAEKNMMAIQPGDVEKTWADVEDLFEYINYRPQVGIEEGIAKFVQWYIDYYKLERQRL